MNNLTGCAGREPRWHPYRRWGRAVEPEVRCWLLDPASLTARVKQACTGRFQVRVLGQWRGRIPRGEAAALGVRPGDYGLIREVRLLCEGTPWVFARTVIPVSSLTGPLRRLARLGNKPLGAVLFADRSMRRGEVELARIGAGQRLFAVATHNLPQPPAFIWGRRSVFWIEDRPLLVSEIFLPDVGVCPGMDRGARAE